MAIIKPYGQWESPIEARALAYDSVSLNAPRTSHDGSSLYYIESDCDGHGRIKRVSPVGVVTPDNFSVGSDIYTYGGGAYTIDAEGYLVFVDSKTRGFYRTSPDGNVTRLVVSAPDTIYGDLFPHPREARAILAVREVRSPGTTRSGVSIVCLDTMDSTELELVQGADYYSHPRFNHDGTLLCWLEWDRPHMPWTGSRLYVARWSCTGVQHRFRVGQHTGISQPRWGLDGRLFYCHDETGYQQLYQVDLKSDDIGSLNPQLLRIRGLEERELPSAEFLLSSNTYFHLDGNYMVVTYTEAGQSQLAVVDLVSGTYTDLDIALNDIAYDALQRINGREFLAIGATSNSATALYHIRLPADLEGIKHYVKAACRITKIAHSFDTSAIPEGMLSTPSPFTFPRSSSEQSPLSVGHSFIMRPTNSDYAGPATNLPPCIVMAHGGPTKHFRPSINLEGQYFTSRGYAVALLNHAGSTGYGRAYRDAMDGQWGIVDVQDALDLVQALAREGMIDPRRVGITGPSAGGYLTLQAICTRSNVWAGAVSVFGIADMSGFAATTHHFESCYDYLLVRGRASLEQGRPTAEKSAMQAREEGGGAEDLEALRELYESRSPVTRASESRVPVLLLQGTEDSVVTADQATAYVRAANRGHGNSERDGERGRPDVKLVMYEHEGHGFHLASTKMDSLLRTEQWWRRTFA
ncbi:Alpha/Beta hydrolase protein [Xylariaceae sp. FL0594]|nr:Alpha/Beta hydrolase protein [Xylariaceae sp. FL0594]